MNNVQDALKDLMGSRFDTINFSEDLLISDLELDSLDVVNVLFRLETKYGVEIPVDVLTDSKTIGDLVLNTSRFV